MWFIARERKKFRSRLNYIINYDRNVCGANISRPVRDISHGKAFPTADFSAVYRTNGIYRFNKIKFFDIMNDVQQFFIRHFIIGSVLKI